MKNQIHVYEAIKQMELLTKQGKEFSFSFYKYNSKDRTGGDLVCISRAKLRAKASDEKIEHSSYKLFFIDLDNGKPLNCWQILITEFEGMKCLLN